MTTGKKFVKDSVLSFLLKFIGMAIGFLLQVVLNRYLGNDGYGKYAIFLTIINIFSLVCVFGIDGSLVRTLARFEDDDNLRNVLLKRSSVVSISITSIVSILLIIFQKYILDFFALDKVQYLYIIIVVLFITSLSKILDGYFQGINRTIISILCTNFLANIFKMVIFLVVVTFDKRYLLMSLITFLLTELGLLVVKLYKIYNINKKQMVVTKESEYTKTQFNTFFRYAFYLSTISGVDVIVKSMDKIMLNSLVNSSEVASYKVAENYLGIVGIFASTFIVFWPIMSRLYEENKIKELEKNFNYVTKIITVTSLPVLVFMITYSSELFAVFGKGYRGSAPVLYILLFGIVIDSLSGPVGALLNMTSYAKYNLIDMIILAVMNFALNVILIPKYGAIGAAIATSSSLSLINLINIVQNKIFLGVFPYDLKNIYLLIGSGVLLFLDKLLYVNISLGNTYVNMFVVLIINYIIYTIFFMAISKKEFMYLVNLIKEKRSGKK
ncbi:flippase [Clostridium fungisolvens]|uniref:Uncharacterized protein n=1 Tax=Clostridium fungisolvens TaxID=1604897 RepID=A0A6V8SGJ7_9CLOT|nr:flippase [Clostridium fungisolvens]GFP74268.1 hypothetical protein bsdtw1_00313 [Clostridium fungisolvens]